MKRVAKGVLMIAAVSALSLAGVQAQDRGTGTSTNQSNATVNRGTTQQRSTVNQGNRQRRGEQSGTMGTQDVRGSQNGRGPMAGSVKSKFGHDNRAQRTWQ